MTAKNTDHEVEAALRTLIGLRLNIARRAADMANFQFGTVTAVRGGTVGQFALHVQCPWRIDGPGGIVTGRLDLFEPAERNDDIPDSWDYEKEETLQARRLRELLGGYDPHTKSFVNETKLLEVESVESNGCGAATLHLSGGFRLVIFPAGTRGEDWRLFRPGTEAPHFVVSGGMVEEPERGTA